MTGERRRATLRTVTYLSATRRPATIQIVGNHLVEFPTQLGRSPSERRLIVALWRQSEKFRSLCQELQLARRAAEFWQRKTSPDAETRCAEYHQLCQELECELRRLLRQRDTLFTDTRKETS